MCVIIHIPKGERISNEELEAAWNRNSDGSGFMYQKDNKVFYERGFMTLEEYKEALEKINGKYELVLHLRISTSDSINKVQTHPYEVGNITNQKGCTTNPVVCMNGIVQDAYNIMVDGCNDTMSYIIKNQTLFMDLINNDINDDIKLQLVEFLKEDTSAKWCVMTPDNVFCTSGFFKKDNMHFSNLIHSTYKNVYNTYRTFYDNDVYDIKDIIKKSKLRKTLYRNHYGLYIDIEDYVDEYCFDCCGGDLQCVGCLKQCKTIPSIKRFKKNNKERFDSLGFEIEYAYSEEEYNIVEDYYNKCDYDYTKYNIFDE